MILAKINRNYLFYSLQFLGWFLFCSVEFFMPTGYTKTYLIYIFLKVSIGGIIGTSIYRVFLKNNVDVEAFGKASVIRLIIAFVAFSAFFYFLFYLSDKLYLLKWDYSDVELEWKNKNSSGLIIGIFNKMSFLFIWTIIYFVIKFTLAANKNKIERIKLNATLKEAQLNTLKGQVNPHFMFNSLNNIRGLMLEDVNKSGEMITKLSEMLEYALAKNTVDTISLNEELEMVDNYIALSKIQMENRLVFEKKVSLETLDINIPPMIIQLLIENAVKHGISNLKHGGGISLKTKKVDELLLIEITNTGKLQIGENTTQLGLKNIKQRLHLLYGAKANFSLEEVNNEVVATIKIPVI